MFRSDQTSTHGYLTLQKQPAQLTSSLTFPITVSTSVEDPTRTPKTPQLLSADIHSTRRSTSPNIGSSSRESSPTPSQLGSASTSNILGGIFGHSGRNRSGSAATRDTVTADNVSEKSTTTVEMQKEKEPVVSVTKTTPKTTPIKTNMSPRPETTITPPTPIEPQRPMHHAPSPTTTLGQRRGRTGSIGNMPSKLSQTQYASDRDAKPLTPTIEVPTPQATPAMGSAQGGFFGSMFAAAQTAATQLGTTIANTSLVPGQTSNKGKKLEISPEISPGGTPVTSESPPAQLQAAAAEQERKRLAVETLGQGELNLASLGITLDDTRDIPRGRTPASNAGSTGGTDTESLHGGNASNQFGLGVHTGGDYDNDDVFGPSRNNDRLHPSEDADTRHASGYATPPQQQHDDENGELRRRSGSVRSAIGRAGRRKRGSSAATTNTAVGGNFASRPSGFAVATTKRNKDFHQLFRSVPENDSLIEDYGCALQKEILLQGRMYVSEGHICFNSNIFGWITTLVISFDEVVSIEKKMTAVVFPNAIAIQTLHARNVFASFISRDSSYDLLVGIWRMSHPTLRTSVNGARLDNGKDEEGSETDGSEEASDGEDQDDSDDALSTNASFSEVQCENGKVETKPVAIRKVSTPLIPGGAENPSGNGDGSKNPSTSEGFPGPATHAVTTCGDESQHFDKPLCDEIIPAPLGKVYATTFGDLSHAWMSKFLVEEEKILDLQFPGEGKFKENGEYGNKKTRGFTYIKPLTGSIGPKQTKCIITDIIEHEDFNKAITILVETRTPDVPNGNMFKVMTRYCMMWAENNSTRLVMNCTVEWSGKSWIKGIFPAIILFFPVCFYMIRHHTTKAIQMLIFSPRSY